MDGQIGGLPLHPPRPVRLSPLHRSPPAPPLSQQQQQRPLLAPVHQPPPVPRDIASLGHGPRARNEYVDSPTVNAVRQNNENNNKLLLAARQHPPVAPSLPAPVAPLGGNRTNASPVVAQQPQALPPPTTSSSGTVLKKKDGASLTTTSVQPCTESIICPQCDKCRCRACTAPRELPSRWLCQRTCELSCQKVVDTLSCVCCVKCILYHGCHEWESNGETPSDDPCACCEQAHCCTRWSLMAGLALCLPCLWLYWPLRCMQASCTAAYDACARPGCKCQRLPGSKRLLMDSDSSST